MEKVIEHKLCVFITSTDFSETFFILRRMQRDIFINEYSTFIKISRCILLRMKNVSEKSVEAIKTHNLCSITFFKNSVVYVVMWKNMVQSDSPQMTIQSAPFFLSELKEI